MQSFDRSVSSEACWTAQLADASEDSDYANPGISSAYFSESGQHAEVHSARMRVSRENQET